MDLTNINPGLQFTNGDLQVIGNSVNNGGNPVLQNGPSEVTFQSGGGITITGSGSDTVTISAVVGAGGLNFAGTVNCSVAPTAANLNGTQGEAWTADTACGGNNQLQFRFNWFTLLANVANGDTIAVGDIIPCSTDDNQGGTAAERANDFTHPCWWWLHLQQVSNNGFTTNSITVGNTAANPRITLNANGNGIFNGQLGTNIADANNAIFVNSTTAPGHTSFAVRGDGRLTIDDADATGNSPNISLNANGQIDVIKDSGDAHNVVLSLDNPLSSWYSRSLFIDFNLATSNANDPKAAIGVVENSNDGYANIVFQTSPGSNSSVLEEHCRITETGQFFVNTTSEIISGSATNIQSIDDSGARIALGRSEHDIDNNAVLGRIGFAGNHDTN